MRELFVDFGRRKDASKHSTAPPVANVTATEQRCFEIGMVGDIDRPRPRRDAITEAFHPPTIRHDGSDALESSWLIPNSRYGETIRDARQWKHASTGRLIIRPRAVRSSRNLAAPAARLDALRERIRSRRVARRLPFDAAAGGALEVIRVIGLDIRRVFAKAVMLDQGRLVRLGRVGMTHENLRALRTN